MNLKYKLILGIGLLGTPAWAQSESGFFTPEVTLYTLVGFVIVTALIVLGVSVVVYNMLQAMTNMEAERKAKEKGVEYKPAPSPLAVWWQSLNDSVPLEEEKSIELDHEYDGIKELDNHLPPWWLALFYGSVVFGVIYMLGYHVLDWWPLQAQEYEIAEAKAQEAIMANSANLPTFDPSTIEYNDDPTFLAAGKTIYDQNCAACHGAALEGGIGPNLADNYWLHGGSMGEIFTTITAGVPQNGMAAWEKSLSGEKRAQVTSYIYSLIGSNPPNGKAPQGELVEMEAAQPETTQVESDSTVVVDVDSTATENIE